MRTKEQIALDVLRCAVSHAPDVRLIGNVRADEVLLLAADSILTCPNCGAEAWCNIDCPLCSTIGAVEADE